MWNKYCDCMKWVQVNLYLQTFCMATCSRCQHCELVEAVTFCSVSSAGKQLNILLAVIYCYIHKSNAKKCSHKWSMGGCRGCESAILHAAKSCCIMHCCQCTWGTRTTPEGHWLLLGRRYWSCCYTLFTGTLFVGGCNATVPQRLSAFPNCALIHWKLLCLVVVHCGVRGAQGSIWLSAG